MGLERAEEMYRAVIDLIRREQPNIIPYRPPRPRERRHSAPRAPSSHLS
jgi:hypothetical protein